VDVETLGRERDTDAIWDAQVLYTHVKIT